MLTAQIQQKEVTMWNDISNSGALKAFPGVQALKEISFRAEGGRVLALLGENGAGKSTSSKYLPETSPPMKAISLFREKAAFTSPYDAIRAGVSVIYQERQMIPQ